MFYGSNVRMGQQGNSSNSLETHKADGVDAVGLGPSVDHCTDSLCAMPVLHQPGYSPGGDVRCVHHYVSFGALTV